MHRDDSRCWETLKEEDWRTVLLQSGLCAQRRASRYGWSLKSALPEGRVLEDVVNESLKAILSGERTWDPPESGKKEDIVDQMVAAMDSVISSKLSHLYRRSKDSVIRPKDEFMDRTPMASAAPTQHEERVANALRSRIMEVAYDSLDGEVLELVLSSTKPATIAEKLDLAPDIVYGIIRKLRKRLLARGLAPPSAEGECDD